MALAACGWRAGYDIADAPDTSTDAPVRSCAAPSGFDPLPSGTARDLTAAWVDGADRIWIAGVGSTVRVLDAGGWRDASTGLPPVGALLSFWSDGGLRLFAGTVGAVWAHDGATWSLATSLDDSACAWPVGVAGGAGYLYGACSYYHGVVRLRPDTGERELLVDNIRGDFVHAFAPDDVFVIMGLGSVVFRYRGGNWSDRASWTQVGQGGFLESVHDVWSPGDGQLVAVGDGGLIRRWDGRAWIREDSGTTANLLAVWGSPGDGLIAVGEDGVALHHDGQRWRPLPTGTTATLRAIRGRECSHVVAIGDGGTVLRVVR